MPKSQKAKLGSIQLNNIKLKIKFVIKDNTKASPEKFRIIRKIGKGSFGKVYAAEKRDTKELFAMKLVEKDLESNENQMQDINQEVEILSTLNHPFLITLWYAFQDEDYVYLVFELLPGGDLRRSIQDQGRLSQARALIHMCETALALDYLKMKKILHRDVKPENLLLDNQGHIRLIDFNTAIKVEDDRLATSMTGTKPYIAPEVFRCALDLDSGYSFPADWWSLGICAYEMLCGKRPYDIHSFTSYEDILGMFLFSKIEFPEYVESEMADLVKQILCVETEQRLSSVDHLRLHPYLKNVNFNQIYEQEIKTALCQVLPDF
ncbi:serine/threonine-protein kinase 32B-like [Uloborus diversus]|uniref:serine/threonine-protein kinase 32B-like n=1 Tax=Uloborus diversus TaxID=327109 RepID=UPI002409DC88|nr:serine/threonine-protein kinase 32B-like [Uloborus diversus]